MNDHFHGIKCVKCGKQAERYNGVFIEPICNKCQTDPYPIPPPPYTQSQQEMLEDLQEFKNMFIKLFIDK